MKRIVKTISAAAIAWAILAAPPGAQSANTATPLTICLATENLPFSSRDKGEIGIDVEIANEMGRLMQRPISFNWIQIPNRGGLGKALRHSLGKNSCELFLGIPMIGNINEELAEQQLVASSPYFSASYVLVSEAESTIKTVNNLSLARRIGVVSAAPSDLYLFENFPQARAPYGSNGDLLKALASGEIDAALIWSSYIARLQMTGTASQASVRETVPGAELSSNFVAAMRPEHSALIKQVNKTLATMRADGFMSALLQRYGIANTGIQTNGQ